MSRKHSQTHPKRREHVRIPVQPMYSAVTASCDSAAQMHGHVYDISIGGVRIELDEPLSPGQSVALLLDLPGTHASVHAAASVVWCNDEQDDPGPRRMALRFTAFPERGDHDRLIDYIGREQARRAA